MSFADQLTRFFQFKRSSQVYFGTKDPYVMLQEDDSFLICDPADTTKCVRFDAGNITTATTRVFTFSDLDLTAGSSSGQRKPALLGSANLAMTAAMSGSVFHCGAAEDFVLPTLASAADNGLDYEWLITTTATSFTITAAAGDLLKGGVSIMSTSAGLENDAFSANGSSDLVLSMNGTTQGGIVGSWVRYTAYDATTWLVRGGLIGSGTIVTPFS